MSDPAEHVDQVGQHDRTARAEVEINGGLLNCVERCEVVRYPKARSGGQLEKRVTEVSAAGEAPGVERGLEGAVAPEKVDFSERVGGRPAAAHPDRTLAAV